MVFGATGNQGGSVVNSILNDPRASQQYSVRGVTRDPSSAKAKALAAKGVECVKVRSSLFCLANDMLPSTLIINRIYRPTSIPKITFWRPLRALMQCLQ